MGGEEGDELGEAVNGLTDGLTVDQVFVCVGSTFVIYMGPTRFVCRHAWAELVGAGVSRWSLAVYFDRP